MNQAELFELMERFDKSGIAELCYRQDGERITLRKACAATAGPVALTATAPAAVFAPAPAVAPAPPEATGTLVRAPLVGTFYTAPAPDSAEFAPVGKKLNKGETICIIEAMKMINEIPAPCSCVVKEILVENGALVGFDEAIFRIEEC